MRIALPIFARIHPHRGLILWLALCAVLTLGIFSTLLAMHHVPMAESLRANSNGQRAVIDPLTGAVSIGEAPVSQFDIGTPADTAEKPPAEPIKEVVPALVKPTEHPPLTSAIAPPTTGASAISTLRTEPLPSKLDVTTSPIERLVPAPAPEISEKTNGLILPRRGIGNASAATIYASHFKREADQHLLVFVILDAGVSAQSLPLILSLPKAVTIAFSPYARDAQSTIGTLRRAGYEAWGMLPLASDHYPQDDPGPLGLLPTTSKDELIHRLHEIMTVETGSVGMVLPPDEAMSKHAPLFTPLLSEIITRGLYLLSTHPTHSIDELTHDEKLQPSIKRADILLDPTPDEAQIESKLAGLNDALKESKSLIVVMSARPQTLLILQRWLRDHPLTAPATLAPLSAIWRSEEPPEPPPEDQKKSEKKSEGEKKPEEKSDVKKAEPEKKPEAAK